MTYPTFPAPTTPEPRHKVAVIGAGPVGLTMALDLAHRGVACVLLDDNNAVSTGSRAICWAKRTLGSMAELVTRRNLADHDAFYARLLEAHRGLSEPDSAALNARLILILANHIGDPEALDQALALARAARPER